MTHRKFQNTDKGYDRAQADREAQSAVEADMLFGDQAENGLADLMANDSGTQGASGSETTGGGWDLPKSLGTAPTESPSFEDHEAPVDSQAQFTDEETSMLSPVPDVETHGDVTTEMPSGPQGAVMDPIATGAAPTSEVAAQDDEKITTVVRRSPRSRRHQQSKKKKGFFGRLFGGKD